MPLLRFEISSGEKSMFFCGLIILWVLLVNQVYIIFYNKM